MSRDYSVNKTRPLSELLENVVLPAYADERRLLARFFHGPSPEIIDDRELGAQCLVITLNGKERLKIAYDGQKEVFISTLQKKDSAGEWSNGYTETVAEHSITGYLNSRISLSFAENKGRNMLRAALASATGVAALALASWVKDARGEEGVQIPDNEQPVATQRHLEP